MARCYWSQKPLCAWRSRFHANLGLYFFGCGCSVVHSSTSKVYSSIIYYCNSLPWCCYSYSSHVVHGWLEGPIASWLVKQNNLCSIHRARMHDKEMACKTWPRNTPYSHGRRKVHKRILIILADQPGLNGWLSCLHSFKIFWPMKPSYTSNEMT